MVYFDRFEAPRKNLTPKVRFMRGAPGQIRTADTWFRRPVLYPLSYGCVYNRGKYSTVDNL